MHYKKIKEIKKKILKVAFEVKEGHIGSSFSILDILYLLYNNVLNITPETVNSPNRDFLILSKAHASLAHSAILLEKGYINEDQFFSYCKHESILGGHLDRMKVPGVEVSAGSLGHGIGVSIGIALAAKIKNKDNSIFVIVGDGEINEGTFWESSMLASHHQLSNLCCIIDYNHSNDRSLEISPLDKKLNSFGWEVNEINGHSHKEILNVFSKKLSNKPRAIIANTIK